jgi:hypothetical protein
VSPAPKSIARPARVRFFDAFVNATPLGMHPKEDACFFDGDIPADLVFDMVYNPARTLLIKRAEEQGCDVDPRDCDVHGTGRATSSKSSQANRRPGPQWRRPPWKR